ncbi:hypothetical protein AMAG_10562 [Allomyces macrogynus ATCC 38327]|uniref:DM10 domain-containing protein n=1 Tax=Allomyces macrogynus (strain ATCC 38327) TaxID=578462 RepID=A0A0L0SR89_ALLM3|nr:hypothetical protein AMAG_10562 [Allomyces macrogynus ATCC 38327]|eukprot:KNE64889.1 hypothetical protein AMAG_10562 [Allomyces macrogynus ATCC 38327]
MSQQRTVHFSSSPPSRPNSGSPAASPRAAANARSPTRPPTVGQVNPHLVCDVRASLPFLPGHQFNFNGKPNFRKSHAFDYSNTVPVFKEDRPGIGGVLLPGQDEKRVQTSAHQLQQLVSDPNAESVPAWIAFDRKVLRFYAYFQEAVQERREEQFRIRKVNILFYLEDDTVHVIEPRGQNSGIPQGTLIRRHRMPRPGTDPHNAQYYLFSDLSVGKEVTFYARTFKIVGCDAFTRDFLTSLAIPVAPNSDYPNDPHESHRREVLARMRPTRPVPPRPSLKKFLENDRKVLRFYSVWDDTTSAFGDARKLVLHYFLADDTMEIHEHIAPNSGRDGNTAFLKRGKVPKRIKVGSSQAVVPRSEDFYTDRDLMIGAVLNVYGRPFLLCDCDEFTKEYFRDRYGLHDFTPIPYDAIYLEHAAMPDVPLMPLLGPLGGQVGSAPAPAAATAYVPPEYNGWGSEEDSLGSCLALTPKPPKKDVKKDHYYGQTVLRFAAVLNTARQVDRERRFVVTYHLSDDTVHVFEPHQRNSGIVGGKWLERCRVKVPGTARSLSTHDLYLGAELVLAGFPFVIIGADEFALRYMDAHPHQFPNHMPRGHVTTAFVPSDMERGRVRFADPDPEAVHDAAQAGNVPFAPAGGAGDGESEDMARYDSKAALGASV